MSTARNGAQPFCAMIDRIKRGHISQQSLRGTDVRGRFFAANVLLASLHCHAQCWVTFSVNRHADHAAGHSAFVRFTRGHKGGVWAAITHRDTETLSRANHDIRAHFTCWFQQGAGQ